MIDLTFREHRFILEFSHYIQEANYEKIKENISTLDIDCNIKDEYITLLLDNCNNNNKEDVLKILELFVENNLTLNDESVIDDIQDEEFREKVQCIINGPSK